MTEIILEGPLGKEFGREWLLAISSPAEALRLIDANKPGIARWIRGNLENCPAYSVVCTYDNGNMEELDECDYVLNKKIKRIVFVPIVEGAGGSAGKIILGAALIVGSFYAPELVATMGASTSMGTAVGGAMFSMGMTMIMSGAAQMLSTPPPPLQQSSGFGGGTNTAQQGASVPLIYGTCLVGSQTISVAMSVDQMLSNQ